MRALSLLVALASAALVAAQDGYGGYGGGYGGGGGEGPPAASSSTGGSDDGATGGDDTSTPAATASSTTAAAAATTSGTAAADSSVASGKVCTDLMCITATINATTTLYELEQTTSNKLGWMAIGFGQTMAGSPMVILWPNSDGTITVSQRLASAEVMPTVDASPPRVATLSAADSSLTSGAGVLAFTVPNAATSGKIDLIWAYGTINPGSSDAAAPLQQHLDSGPTSLTLTSGSAAATGGTTTPTTTAARPLVGYQKLVLAHAVLFVVAFMLLLPAGVLFARLLRTTSVNWFRAHWLIQGYITAPVIATAFLLGIVATAQQGSGHFNDRHKQVGLVLVILYLAQVSLGAVIHFVKDPKRVRRPPQNYAHAVLGLSILGLALYQIRLGYTVEWPTLVGLRVPKCVNAIWIAWTVVFALVYVAGLALVPRQYQLEAARRSGRL